tara:strand:- start:97 stop:1650 length:1554 start_codon:yes stop_codon:yes gene_type:complete
MNIGNITAKWAQIDFNRPALIDIPANRRISFGELDCRIRKLGNALCDNGIEKGSRIAILAKNSIEYFELYFACARVGLIAQPLNWRLAVPELARILSDASPSLIVTSDEFHAERAELQSLLDVPRWVEFGVSSDGSYEKLLGEGGDNEPLISSIIGGDDPALILYTGGTTGLSKGALHSHKTLFMGMVNQTVAERVVPTDVYMLTGQMFHIPVALAMNYMAHGCPVVLMNFEAKSAMEIIEAERVSAFLGITTMLNWMMAVDGFDRYDISSLRNIQYGGGPMPETVVKAALESFPCTLIQGYGQTEGMTMTFLSQEDHLDAIGGKHPERLNSCGRQGFVTEVSVVDESGKPVPRDGITAGEIVVKSEANMLGYWNQPELNANTLKDGWLWTGDIANWDSDGYLFIVDRAKDMIISGGENIFSTQVETAIHKHPSVLECAVIGVPDDEWGESVKAVVVLKPDCSATEREVIDTAAKHLARYQKPKSVDFVDSLPKAPTGKILKRELKDPYWGGQSKKV